MLIIPAIDIRGGSCVRLFKGDPEQMTVYSSDPIQMAKAWVEKGAKRIHVVDLDGAFAGQPHYLDLAGKMKKEVGCEIEFGGGLRTKESVKKALDLGIDKIILGTAALEGLDWIASAIFWHQERFIVAIDAQDNNVSKEGWKEDSSFTVDEALAKMESLGFQEVIYTDISRDGTLSGPNFESVRKVVVKTRMGVYASGGISSMDDVKKLKEIPGLKGMVIGKALYAGKINLADCYK